MNKKLLAVAIASVLAAPATALAQVTISGVFKVGIDQYKVSNPAATRTQTSEMRLTDNSSRILFNVTEDLGGGLAAIGQWDVRAGMDSGAAAAISGNTWVGLRSNSWGTVTLGRHDLHYGKQPDDLASKGGALMAAAVSLMDYAGGGATAVAVTSRTANVVRWDSTNMGGFTVTAAYSTSVAASEADLTAGANTKGSAYNLNPAFTASNFQIGGSVWNSKSDGATTATVAEQASTVIYGYYTMAGWKIGAASNGAKLKTGGVQTSKRTAWTVPVSYTTGPHTFYAHYTKAGDDKTVAGDNTSKMMAFAYNYDLSKRTSVGITYAKIDNAAAASYSFFTNTSGGGLSSANTSLAAGEDGSLMAFTLRHVF